MGDIFPRKILLGPNYPQESRVIYEAPDISGSVLTVATFEDDFPMSINIDILVPGLVPLSPNPFLRLKAPTAIHPSAYWVTPRFREQIYAMAALYNRATGKAVTCTDASLPWGGVFDLHYKDIPWTKPHRSHGEGTSADFRVFDQNVFETNAFLDACQLSFLEAQFEPGKNAHWHVIDTGVAGPLPIPPPRPAPPTPPLPPKDDNPPGEEP